ncbi:hypothetical protein [Agrobacterium tumefaciens]|uniref:hypothetical protein n=1 Tax=Agrobacterium tumefaciens TaxID=358 RepID=UPI0021D16C03|nr:hypothetical protein [Agrobacterium tumefaciens]UXS01677.1 hypothetical protein FY156_09460 [Agrobacterium tumefaciens]
MSELRKVFTDPNFRPVKQPLTETFCALCEKDLKDGKPRRYICYEFETMSAIHPDDWEKALYSEPANFYFKVLPVGMDCARRIGLEFTSATPTK